MVNVTHGFPQNPVPVFQSTRFDIENRPGLEDQKIERVLSQLGSLGAPDVVDSRHRKPGEAQKVFELAKWLSDWHLVAFLDTTQLFPLADMKILMEVATSPTLMSDPSQLDPLLATDGWQTLMTFTRENGPQSASGLGAMDDIPQDILDQIAAEQAAASGSAPASGSGTPGVKICPHCTFENDVRRTDCDVCGLPL